MGFYGMLIGGWASRLASTRCSAACAPSRSSCPTRSRSRCRSSASSSRRARCRCIGIVKAQDDYWYIVPQIVGFVIFYHRGAGRVQPAALRPRRGRRRDRRRLPHRVRRACASPCSRTPSSSRRSCCRRSAPMLFLGGWRGPCARPGADLDAVEDRLAILFMFIWIRATLPRLRYDRLMKFGWKVLLPIATLNLVGYRRVGGAAPSDDLDSAPARLDRSRRAKGFAVTLRHLFRKPVTEQYPEYKRPVYPRFRGRHRLHRHDNGLEKCIGCSLCAAACPADCIRVVAAENEPRAPRLAGRALRAHLRDQHGALHLLRLLRDRVPVRRDHARQRLRALRALARRADLHQGDAARAAAAPHARRRIRTSSTAARRRSTGAGVLGMYHVYAQNHDEVPE